MEEEKQKNYNSGGNSAGQKVLFFGFIIFGSFSLILAFFQLKHSLNSPFYIPEEEVTPALAESNNNAQDIFALQKIDTDRDGLTDYDELYVYETSPYLEDSDSDGYNDKIEIESNNNPNCPRGADCGLYLNQDLVVTGTSSIENATTSDVSAEDAAYLRSLLLSEGIPADFLEQISDEELISEYAAIIGNSEGLIENSEIQTLENLTPDEIRILLNEKGIDKEILDKIDDETLKSDFLDTLRGM